MSHTEGLGPCCPDCAGPLVSYSSRNQRQCADCKEIFPWHLAPGQKPLVTNNRHDRKEQTV